MNPSPPLIPLEMLTEPSEIRYEWLHPFSLLPTHSSTLNSNSFWTLKISALSRVPSSCRFTHHPHI